MIIKYDGAMLNGVMEGRGRAEYGDGEVGAVYAVVTEEALDRQEKLRRSRLFPQCHSLPRHTLVLQKPIVLLFFL